PVEDERLVGRRCREAAPDKTIDRGKESSQRLAGPGGRGNQNVAPRLNLGPRPSLRLRRCGKVPAKPAADGRMERSDFFHGNESLQVHKIGDEQKSASPRSEA